MDSEFKVDFRLLNKLHRRIKECGMITSEFLDTSKLPVFFLHKCYFEITSPTACWLAGGEGVTTPRERRGDLVILCDVGKVDLEVSKPEKDCLQKVLITCISENLETSKVLSTYHFVEA